MKRFTTSLLVLAASGALIAGCSTNATGRGYANRNGSGQGACLANGNGSNVRQFNGNGPGPNARIVNSSGPRQGACAANCDRPGQNTCLANGNGPGPRNFAANGNGRGQGPGAGNGKGNAKGNGNGRGGGPGPGNAGQGRQNGNGPCCGGNAASPIALGAATPLNAATADALRVTLEDELTARAFYAAILAKHGDVRPFTNIMHAEERHAQAIRALMQRYQVDGTGVTARALPEIPATVPECAKLAAQIERDNVALYDRFIRETAEVDVKAAFERLRAASLDNHLPAFERVAGA